MTYRPRNLRLGAMRERITVETATVDASTGQPVRTWATVVANEPAAFEQVTGGETLRGRQVEANVTAIFTVRFRSNTYSVEQRITHNGIEYGIVRVMPVEGGRRYIELRCKASEDVDAEE